MAMAVAVVDRDIGRERGVPQLCSEKSEEKEGKRERENIAKVANVEG